MSQSTKSFDSMVSTLRSVMEEEKDDMRVCPRKRKFEEMMQERKYFYTTIPRTSKVRLMVVDETR